MARILAILAFAATLGTIGLQAVGSVESAVHTRAAVVNSI